MLVKERQSLKVRRARLIATMLYVELVRSVIARVHTTVHAPYLVTDIQLQRCEAYEAVTVKRQ